MQTVLIVGQKSGIREVRRTACKDYVRNLRISVKTPMIQTLWVANVVMRGLSIGG